jgi:hypothetical protein
MIVLIDGGSASAAENRGRRPAGPPSRNADRHPVVRQELGAGHHPARAAAANLGFDLVERSDALQGFTSNRRRARSGREPKGDQRRHR